MTDHIVDSSITYQSALPHQPSRDKSISSKKTTLKHQDKSIATGDTGDTGDTLENKGLPASPVGFLLPGTSGTGLYSDSKGVWLRAADKPEEPPIWICSPLKVVALTRTPDDEAWGRLLEFADPDGRKHEWACPLELLAGDGLEFRRILLSLGLRIAPSGKARQMLASYVQTYKVKDRAICTDTPGWHDGAFVLLDETIGQKSGERVLLQTTGEPPKMRQAGTVEEWRVNLGRYCEGNSRLILAVSMAFAGPMLAITGDESGGLNLVGSSSTGKTTALKVAASVWGGPEFLHRWRATDNGLEAVAQIHNDNLLILDELAQVDPRYAGEIAYMLANGTGKHRARRDGLARKAATWRLLFLSAGEIGIAAHMGEVGKRARAGQEVRLADIPADAGKGHGLFEELHGFPSGVALAEYLNEKAGKAYGTAGRVFVRGLVGIQASQLKERVEVLRADFLSSKVPPGADGQALRVASRLALIAASGELATTFTITGWAKGAAIKAAGTCFDAWLERRGGSGSQEQTAALAQVHYFIEAHGESRFTDLDSNSDRNIVNRAGFRRRTEAGIEYLVLPEVFKREVCAGFDYRLVARVLRDKGMLRIEDASHLTIKVRGIGRVYCIMEKLDEG
jgi:putative DNA primase/helicase